MRCFSSSNQRTTNALCRRSRFSRADFPSGVKWLFRLLQRKGLLKLTEPVEGNAHLRMGPFARSGLGCWEDGYKPFAVRSDVIGPWPNHEYPFNDGGWFTKCETRLSADIHGNQPA